MFKDFGPGSLVYWLYLQRAFLQPSSPSGIRSSSSWITVDRSPACQSEDCKVKSSNPFLFLLSSPNFLHEVECPQLGSSVSSCSGTLAISVQNYCQSLLSGRRAFLLNCNNYNSWSCWVFFHAVSRSCCQTTFLSASSKNCFNFTAK